MKTRSISSFMLLGALCASGHAQDVQMNQPDDFGTQDNSTVQSETNHATTAKGVLAAWNDASQMNAMFTSLVRWRYSTDSGASFTGGDFFTVPNRQCRSDPAIVADGQGFFYLAAVVKSIDTGRRSIAFARSTGNTPPFSFPANPEIIEPAVSGDDLDKELMAVDRTGGIFNDRIYISATELGSFVDRIVVKYTSSLSPLKFSDWCYVSPDNVSSVGSMPAVAPNGHVYVIWTTKPENVLQFAKSTNGGRDFKKPRTIATFKPVQGLLTPGQFKMTTINTPPYGQIAIDSTSLGSPTRGNVYVVYAADPDGAGCDKGDIFFTRSTNGGKTWAVPRSITSGLAVTRGRDLTTNDSWMPSITASPVNGHIYVTFYDRRDDPDNNTLTRVYRALSTDGGLTWENAPLGAESFVPIVGFPQAGANSYWGDYNWATADTSGVHFTWGDSHNLCKPSAGSTPCSPKDRPDLDAYYHTTANLSGADLFIQPWGAVTGIGPAWQTPDVFVVDAKGRVVNARKGFVNRLRARVRNLGNKAATGVVVHFRYAPWFAGVNDSLLKEIGTVRLNFPEAGRAGDTQIAKINWNLTNTRDTNGGRWPAPIGAFEHFCVKVSIEFAGDINLSNNAAQNNFVEIKKAGLPNRGPLLFMILGPDKRVDPNTKHAELRVSELPPGFSASLSLRGTGNPAGFDLLPDEVRLAQVKFTAPKKPRLAHDIVADATLLLDGKPASGISARLYRSPRGPGDLHGIGPVTSAYWNVKPPPKPPDQPSPPGFEHPLPPPRVIPKGVKYHRTYMAGYEEIFRAAIASFKEQEKEQEEGPALINPERGLINSRAERLTAEQIRALVVTEDVPRVTGEGYAIVSLYFQQAGEGKTEVGAASLIAVDDEESPLGRVLTSNGTLENRYLDAMTSTLKK